MKTGVRFANHTISFPKRLFLCKTMYKNLKICYNKLNYVKKKAYASALLPLAEELWEIIIKKSRCEICKKEKTS